MRGRLLIAAALVTAMGARARAGDGLDDDVKAIFAHAWEGAAAMPLGDMPYGGYSGSGIGLGLAAGRRWDRLLVFGEYQFVAESGQIGFDTLKRRAYLNRFAANVRYDLLQTDLDHEAPISLFVEAGVGEELLRWAEGGSLHRPDLSAGFGAQVLAPTRHHNFYGITIRLQLVVAHAPAQLDAMPRCGGPCYAPSTPMTTDLGVLYVMGFPFGG